MNQQSCHWRLYFQERFFIALHSLSPLTKKGWWWWKGGGSGAAYTKYLWFFGPRKQEISILILILSKSWECQKECMEPELMAWLDFNLRQWSSYDRAWFSGPDKQEILILIWISTYVSESAVTAQRQQDDVRTRGRDGYALAHLSVNSFCRYMCVTETGGVHQLKRKWIKLIQLCVVVDTLRIKAFFKIKFPGVVVRY
jgi:hypothetical protein